MTGAAATRPWHEETTEAKPRDYGLRSVSYERPGGSLRLRAAWGLSRAPAGLPVWINLEVLQSRSTSPPAFC